MTNQILLICQLIIDKECKYSDEITKIKATPQYFLDIKKIPVTKLMSVTQPKSSPGLESNGCLWVTAT